ncbi:MAG: hypothetical protein NVS4B13_06590 [Candidatus Elarobacter sp.]
MIDPAARAVRRVETAGGRPIASYGRVRRAADGAAFALDRNGPLESGTLDEVATVAQPLGPPVGPVPAFLGDVPLALSGEPVPIVPCRLGGRNARCLLDSGATPSAITLALAEALGLEPHGELEIAGMGRFATGFVEVGPLALGAASFERARFAVIPQTSAARFDAVIGSDLLGRLRLVLDRARGTARILRPGTHGDGAPAANTVRVTFHGGAPMVQTMFGPQGARALLDTGDQSTLSFGYAAYRVGPQWPVVSRGQAIGIAGADDILTVEIPDVRVGPLALGPTRAIVRRTQAAAHVGIGLWSRYIVELDEAAGRVSFSPR